MSFESKKREKTAGDWSGMVRFIRTAKFSWLVILLAFLVSISASKVRTMLPGNTADIYSGDFSAQVLWNYVLFWIGLAAVNLANNFLRGFAQTRSVRSVRTQMWDRMLHTKSKAFGEDAPEYFLSSITNDAPNAVSGVLSLILTYVPGLYYVITAIQEVGTYNQKLMFSIYILIPLYVLYAVLVGRWSYRTRHRVQTDVGRITGRLAERLRSLGLIKSYGTEQQETVNGEQTIRQLFHSRMNLVGLDGAQSAYTLLTDVLVNVIAVIWGAYLLRTGEIDLETWIVFFLFVPSITNEMRTLSYSWVAVKNLQGTLRRVRRVMEAPQEELFAGQTSVRNGDLVFQDVEFSYGERKVLQGVSLTVPKGGLTAVVGLSGSGKTTLMKLAERLYEPEKGVITLGGTEIQKLELAEYRKHLAYVQQDSEMFGGTFREVLTYGVEKPVGEKELEEAVKQVGMLEFIQSHPKGFDSEISYWGASLSGGQRQKLALARELLKDTEILLLDEPTSALDAKSAREIRRLLFGAFAGKTILLVTHDLHLITQANQIALLEQGRIEGCGTHEALMKSSSRYRELVEEQSYQEVYGR